MMPTHPGERPVLRRARTAVAAVFAVHGVVSASFATRIPWLQDRLDLSVAQLGLVLAFPVVGASLAMPLAGRITHRWGARWAVRGLIVLFVLSLPLPVLAPHPAVLCAALAVFGATAGMADVAMNAQGVEVERRYGRSIMSGLHGLWSVGALLGSAAGVGAVHLAVDARTHHLFTVALLLALVPVLGRGLLEVRPAPGEAVPPRFALPPRSSLLVGAVGMCALLAEGASMDWSGVYLRDVTGAPEAVAVSSFTAFSCTMATARLAGDAVVRRIGPVGTVRTAGMLAVLGGVLVTSAPGPALGITGFALIGTGIAVVVPLCFAAAGRSTATAPSQAIAGVATVTYLTGLVAPTLIGTVGELTSLRMSFALVTAAAVAMTLGAGVLAPAGAGRTPAPAGDTAAKARAQAGG